MAWRFYDVLNYFSGVGPMPCKRWVKSWNDRRHRMHYRAYGPRSGRADIGPKEYNERLAISYARWLASRDHVPLVENHWHTVVWADFQSRYSNRSRGRIMAVRFGMTTSPKNVKGKVAPPRQVYVTIAIPHWNYEHPPIAGLSEDDAERIAA